MDGLSLYSLKDCVWLQAGDHWALHLTGVTYDGASNWGLFFLIMLAVCGVGYVAGGVGYVHKTQGAAPALTAHPHFAQYVHRHPGRCSGFPGLL